MKTWIALGTNLGNRYLNIAQALDKMNENGIKVLQVADILETAPYGNVEQDSFLNTVCMAETELRPKELIAELMEIEKSMGRIRGTHWGPRIIDLDIIFYEDEIVDEENLKIPHPDMTNRLFVLEPLFEISPEKIHPVLNKTVEDLFNELRIKDNMEWVEKRAYFGIKLGLDNIKTILKGLSNPQNDVKCIHVAGTNGKGSVCTYLSSVLKDAGYKVGLFTSPFIQTFNERFQINGEKISTEDLDYHIAKVRDVVEKMERDGSYPTHFEILTAICFDYFKKQNVDIAVMEVGMGGMYDSTNVIEKPLASVITTIGFDHTEYLGNKIEEIATQKGGIIKQNCPVFLYPNAKEPMDVFKAIAKEKDSQCFTLSNEEVSVKKIDHKGTVYSFRDYEDVELSMIGEHQAVNASLAIITLEELKKAGVISYTKDKLYNGLKKGKLIARLELLQDKPMVVLDGSHNVEGITALKNALKYYKYDKLILGIGILKDKSHLEMAALISPLADEIVVTEIPNDRKLSAEELAKEVSRYCKVVHVESVVGNALEKSIGIAKKDDLVLWAGSLYLMGYLRTSYYEKRI